jgi:prepilin-type N-terminal cleavage/methylation domain-containing protein
MGKTGLNLRAFLRPLPSPLDEERGFTLVETLITMGVASLIFLGTTAVVLDGVKQKRRSDAGAAKLSLDQEIRLITRNVGICNANMAGVSVPDDKNSSVDVELFRGRLASSPGAPPSWVRGQPLLSSSSTYPTGYLGFGDVLISQPRLRLLSQTDENLLMLEINYESATSNDGGRTLGQALNRGQVTFWAEGTQSGSNWTISHCSPQASESGELSDEELCKRLDTKRNRYEFNSSAGTCVTRAIGVLGEAGTDVECPPGFKGEGVNLEDGDGDPAVGISHCIFVDTSISGCEGMNAAQIGSPKNCKVTLPGLKTAGSPCVTFVSPGYSLPPSNIKVRGRCIPNDAKRIDE